MGQELHRERVVFRLERDSDGYPPADKEGLWAKPRADGYYEIDNIPFFATGISSGDVISVRSEFGELEFDHIVEYGGHTTLRIVVFDNSFKDIIRKKLESMGCETEGSHIPSLFSVDIPPQIDYAPISSFLSIEEGKGHLEYEEASLQHD